MTEYIKIMYVIFVLRNENERDLRSNEHYLSYSENMDPEKIQACIGFEDRKLKQRLLSYSMFCSFHLIFYVSFRKIS